MNTMPPSIKLTGLLGAIEDPDDLEFEEEGNLRLRFDKAKTRLLTQVYAGGDWRKSDFWPWSTIGKFAASEYDAQAIQCKIEGKYWVDFSNWILVLDRNSHSYRLRRS